MPKLKGKVFHATSTDNITLIEKSGAILPNQNNNWSSQFGSAENGYFRLRGCVSFFDYRKYGSADWAEHAYKCTPMQLFDRTNVISILVLSEELHCRLESWIQWKQEEKWSQRVVPHIEAGYPGPVLLEYISEHIVVECIGS